MRRLPVFGSFFREYKRYPPEGSFRIIVLQPRKVQRAGIWDAVDGRVLISVHKEHMIAAVAHQHIER